jgi:hypothetical protein
VTTTLRYGDDLLPPRFWDKVVPEPNSGCWLWTATVNSEGYGSFYWEGRMKLAHRVALGATTTLVEAMEADHQCCNTGCVNPEHLDQVTGVDNRLAAVVRRASCRAGHAYTDASTLIVTKPSGSKFRQCRICNSEAAARYKTRLRTRRIP